MTPSNSPPSVATALVLGICAALALSACGDDRYILVEVSEPGGWVIDGGRVDGGVPAAFPYPIVLRFGVESVVDHEPTRLVISAGTMTPFETKSGLPCEVAVAPTCQATTCNAELSVLGAGNCMVRMRATTEDGEAHGGCWYRVQLDARDQGTSEQAVADDYQRCLDSL